MPIPISNHLGGGLPLRCRAVWLCPLPLILLLVAACDGYNTVPVPVAEPDDLFWKLELNHHAVTLSTTAPYDTLTLVATPKNYRNELLSGLPAPTYSSSNPDVVLVSNEGLLVGLKPTSGMSSVKVTATVISENVKHVDSLVVRVVNNPTPPVLDSFSIQPIPPDSAKTAALGTIGASHFLYTSNVAVGRSLPLRAIDTTGASILSGLLVWCRSADTTIASFGAIFTSNGPLVAMNTATGLGQCMAIQGARPGVVKIYASMTAYGVSKSDTVLYRIGWPLMEAVNVGPGPQGEGNIFGQPEIRIGPGGLIYWTGDFPWYGVISEDPLGARFGLPRTTTPTEIVFDDPTNVLAHNPSNVLTSNGRHRWCGVASGVGANCDMAGNFVLDSAGYAMRRFPVPGTYVYRNPLNGAQGRIIVADE